MKNRIIKILSALICLALVFTIISVMPTSIRGDSTETVVLFYNDRAWTLARLPVEKVHSLYYVPITFMVQLPNVDVRVNESLKTFIITHGDYFVSFDTTSDFAVNHEKVRMYLKTGEYHNERYIPASTVCAHLKLGYEEYRDPVSGALAIRVTDGNETKTLKELAEQRYPSLFKIPEVTESVETTAPKPVLPKRVVYLTFENSPGAYTEDILDVLDEFDMKATFFVVGEDMDENAALLSKIKARGHTLALQSMSRTDTATDTESLLFDIEAQNELLYELIKEKSHIRKAPDVGSDVYASLGEMGYYLWRANITVDANVRNARTAANSIVEGIWKNDIAIISIAENQYTAAALKQVLAFIKEYSDSCEMRTVSPIFRDDGGSAEQTDTRQGG